MTAAAKSVATGGDEGHPGLPAAALACMGVVFGDIGTSPLYTLNVAVKSASPARSVVARSGRRHRLADLLVADRRHFDQIR